MSSQLPAALKAADIQRFATRASQLEKYKPIVTYWLEYYILQRIIKDELHSKSSEAAAYAGELMDKLEQTKATYATEAAVTDDVAAKAYMEQFALQTFSRAEADQTANKVTRQTADTFQAAATFFDSLNIWGELDPECHAKSKFGKFHALRIARALKEGKDPNETNPKVEPEPTVQLDEEDAELKAIEQELSSRSVPQPSVQSVPDETVPAAQLPQEVSPMDVDASESDRPVSIGGGYFPSVPTTTNDSRFAASDLAGPHIDEQTEIPRQATVADVIAPSIDDETHIPRQATMADMRAPNIDDESHVPRQATIADMASSNIDQETHIPATASSTDPTQFYASAAKAPPPTIPTSAPPFSSTNFRTDDEAVLAAQKHAKWAISALNFEDVPTAVKELRIALQSLGGL
ncbi:hypothetical protein AMS68_001948 [Peltaster fructicola]|uniref:Vta1 C-terminal domain-containing protein n=1 Tax=Peltaster fructicola TaxID=286661 RepID=A0A6H0XP48_9PEZI|nr:hypothetical protein AMS68_001948 [Peltaster fructicola]